MLILILFHIFFVRIFNARVSLVKMESLFLVCASWIFVMYKRMRVLVRPNCQKKMPSFSLAYSYACIRDIERQSRGKVVYPCCWLRRIFKKFTYSRFGTLLYVVFFKTLCTTHDDYHHDYCSNSRCVLVGQHDHTDGWRIIIHTCPVFLGDATAQLGAFSDTGQIRLRNGSAPLTLTYCNSVSV